MDPITYAFKSIIPQQFVCGAGSSSTMCSKIEVLVPGAAMKTSVLPGASAFAPWVPASCLPHSRSFLTHSHTRTTHYY